MILKVAVENIKCGGCANSIRKQLLELEGIRQVDVNIEEGLVMVEGADESAAFAQALRDSVTQQLLKMGYPEAGSVEGLKATGAKAKSFVSCAVGRWKNDQDV